MSTLHQTPSDVARKLALMNSAPDLLETLTWVATELNRKKYSRATLSKVAQKTIALAEERMK
jgi:hypothetical protein